MKDIVVNKSEKQFINSLNVQQYKTYVLLCKEELKARKCKKAILFKEKNEVKDLTEFFIIYKSFLPMLRKFKSSGEIKLYIYCGLSIDYKKGCFKADYKKICEFFGCKERVIYKWLCELVKKNLIFIKKEKKNSYIFIKPYGIDNDNEYNYKNEDTIADLQKTYKKWIEMCKDKKTLFFIVHSNFKKNLKMNGISAGAIKLYIYCGLSMNKRTGTLTQSLKTIGETLGELREDGISQRSVSIKTLCIWFKELKEYKLVEKQQLKFNGASTIYIKPTVKIESFMEHVQFLKIQNFNFIGNSETKIVHNRTCPLSNMILKKNKIFFNNLQSAEKKGYHICKTCLDSIYFPQDNE